MTLNEEAAASAFPNTFRAGVAAARGRIEQHIPSLTEENEREMDEVQAGALYLTGEHDYADVAIRTCHCGARIDGFYDYVDHLKDVLRDD